MCFKLCDELGTKINFSVTRVLIVPFFRGVSFLVAVN